MNQPADSACGRQWSRRKFVKLTAAAGVTVGIAPGLAGVETRGREDMPYRALGRTGEKVSVIGLGGYHIGVQDTEAESVRLIRTALDRGINFLDNCWDYNGGASEIRMGKALQDGYRDKAFLMSKIDGRTKEAAARLKRWSICSTRPLWINRFSWQSLHRRYLDSERLFGTGRK